MSRASMSTSPSGVAAEVAKRTAAGKPKPTLATVLVGDRPDSMAYVASKGKACLELGMDSGNYHLPGTATQAEVEALVRRQVQSLDWLRVPLRYFDQLEWDAAG